MFNNGLMNADVAIEIIAEMLANCVFALKSEKDENKIKELEEKKKLYTIQREKIYSGDIETINYVIENYGKKLKEQR
ncbi:MAG: hypothetical protein J6A15_04595 [Clostridia bacterium]|nr:hypothetical protein [Clostridia bacterium]